MLLCSASCDTYAHPLTTAIPASVPSMSDDDAPIVPRYRVVAASDSRALRSLFAGDAEEASGAEDSECSGDDSFIVSDHDSVGMASSVTDNEVDTAAALHLQNVLDSLRHRRQFITCPQCLRLSEVVLSFITAFHNVLE
jgi:hypothetical protein